MNKDIRYLKITSNIFVRIVCLKANSGSLKESVIFNCIFSSNSKINNFYKDLAIKILRKMKSGMAPKDDRLIMINIAVSGPVTLA